MLPIFHNELVNIEAAERRALNQEFRLNRRVLRDQSNPFEYPEDRFRELFRFSRELALELITNLQPHLHAPNHPTAISVELKIFSALRFYATGSYQRCVGQEYTFGMSQTSVHRSIMEVTRVIDEQLSPRYVVFPQTIAERNEKKNKFFQRWGIGGVIGAIDGTHIAIQKPTEDGHNYMNRKGFYSKNIQIVCDADLVILNVNAGFPGSCHDAFIWRSSYLQVYMRDVHEEGETNAWLLGDSGYPLQPYLLTPVGNPPPNSPEARYNAAHSSARNCVERCIGVLKNRFRCLHKERTARYDPHFMGILVNTCSVLHNMCLQANMVYNEPNMYDDDVNGPAGVNADAGNLHNEGLIVRNGLINRYFA